MGGGGPGDTTKIIQVPIAAIGGIIGRGGSLIKQLIQESGARIQIQQKHEVVLWKARCWDPLALPRSVGFTH